MPALAVEIDWTSNPLAVPSNWTDMASRVRGFSFDYGRQRELDRTEVGSGTILFKNLDRALDPSHTGSPYYPNVVPMRHVRIRVTRRGQTYDVARGFIRSFPQSWPGKLGAEVAVEFEDAFSVLARMDLSAYSTEVLADQPVGYWRLREMTGTTALDEGGNSAGPFNGTYTGSFTLNQVGPLYGGSGTAALTNASNGNVIIGNQASLNLAGDLTIEFWWRPSTFSELAQETLLGSSVTAPAPYEVTTAALGVGNGAKPQYSGWDQSGQLALTYPLGWANGTLPANAWGHVVITRENGRITFYVNGVAYQAAFSHLSAVKPSASVDVRIGRNTRDSSGIVDSRMAHVAIYDHALSSDRIAAHYAAKIDTFVAQATGSHIGAILDAVGWPVGERNIDTGNSTIQETTPDGNALEWLLRVAEDSEYGLLSISGDGKISFHERHSLWKSPHSISRATFGDDVGELPYSDLELTYDDTDLYSAVRVERENGIPQVAVDPTAKERYGPRILPRTGLLINSDGEASDAANYLLSRYKTPGERPERLSVVGGNHDGLWVQILSRAVHHDRITIKRRPPGGGEGYGDVYSETYGGDPSIIDANIEGLSHSVITPNTWQTTWSLVPADQFAFWQIEDPVYGKIDSIARIGY